MLPNALQPSATDHIPVLAEEVRDLLRVERGDTVVDATFGAGGHAELLAADLRGEGKLVAIDRDPSARTYFERFRRRTGIQARFLRGEFATVLGQLAANGMRADAILLDLGVSSMQIDQPERGFSYAVDAPLDMRMDQTADMTAADFVNELDERELEIVFRRYGEERFARAIAREIGRRRRVEPFERTGQLVDAIKAAIPAPPGSATAIPRDVSSRRSGSRSTTSSASSTRRSPRRSRCSVPAAASPSSASTRSKTGSSSVSSATSSAGASARRTSRSAPAGASRCFAS